MAVSNPSGPTMVDSEVRSDASGPSSAPHFTYEEAHPKALGDWQVRAVLGRGGMSVVYRCEHRQSGEEAAVKVVRVPSVTSLAAIRREIAGLQDIEHPSVVRVIDSGVEDSSPWYAMELLEGETLRGRLRTMWGAQSSAAPDNTSGGGARASQTAVSSVDTTTDPNEDAGFRPAPTPSGRGRVSAAGGNLDELLRIALRLCEGLAVVHGKGLVHRDLKPDNVILRPDGSPVLLDFGLMTRFGAIATRETVDGEFALAGTPGYMAPEQILQELVDARADLYALGCLLYEGIVGRRPFGSAKALDLVQRHLWDTPKPPSEFVAGVSPELDALVLGLLARQPSERVGHADDVARVLARLLGVPVPAGLDTRTYLYRPSLAGRRELLNELDTRLQRAEAAEGGVVLLGGPSGIGKTRLAMELMAGAARRQVRVFSGTCDPLGVHAGDSSRMRGAPLHPFGSMLRSIGDLCQREGTTATARIFGDRLSVLASYEPSLASLPGSKNLLQAISLSGDSGQRRVLHDLAKTMSAVSASEPFLLVIDDVQWADPLTLKFLELLAKGNLAIGSALIVCTYRVEEASEILDDLRSGERTQVHELGRLPREAIRSMIEDMLATSDIPDDFVTFIDRESAGSPYFVAEYLRTAVEDGLITRKVTGQWTLAGRSLAAANSDVLPLPSSVEQLIERRFEGLDEEAMRVLCAAAVLGRKPRSEELLALTESEAVQLADHLGELLAHELLSTGGEGGLMFAHEKVREIAYAKLDAKERRKLHVRAAAVVEKSDRDPSRFSELAQHYERAGKPAAQFRYLLAAGEHALEIHASRNARSNFERARRVLEEFDALGDEAEASGINLYVPARSRARLEYRYAWTNYLGGDVEAYIRYCNRALDELGLPLPRTPLGWGWATARGVGLHLMADARPGLLRVGDEERRKDMELAAEITSQLCWSYVFTNEPIRAMAASLAAVAYCDRAGVRGPDAVPLTMLGAAAASMQREKSAQRYFERARASARDDGDKNTRYVQAWLEAATALNLGEWDRAEPLLSEVLDESRKAGDFHGMINSWSIFAMFHYYRGELRESLKAALTTCDLASAHGYTVLETVGRAEAASAYLALGDPKRALSQLLPISSTAHRREGVAPYLSAIATQAGALVAAGRVDEGRAKADEAWALMDEHPAASQFTYPIHHWIPFVYLHAWGWARDRGSQDARELEARAAAALAGARRFARRFPIGQPVVLRHRALEARLEGRARAARSFLRKARDVATELGMHHQAERAKIQLDQAGSTLSDSSSGA